MSDFCLVLLQFIIQTSTTLDKELQILRLHNTQGKLEYRSK